MADVEDLPRRAAARTVKLAGLPLGYAGRATLGLGKRIGGRPAEIVAAEVQARTAEQLFKVLGELKGGAMKFGQAMSVFEAALPENLAGPYRETLTKLQEAAPPLPASTVHRVLARELGTDWRDRFQRVRRRARPPPPRSARCTGRCGPTGATSRSRCSTPAPAQALLSDLNQIGRMSRLVGMLVPGLEVKPLVAELKARVAEELDYELEAEQPGGVRRRRTTATRTSWSRTVVDAHRAGAGQRVGRRHCRCPGSSPTARREQRDRAGLLLARFLFSGPARAGLLHADPHPGNFRLLDDGRLVVLDYGAVNRLPDGLPAPIGPLLRLAVDGRRRGRLRRAARRGVRPARGRPGRPAAARLPRADPRAGPGRRPSGSAAPGCAARRSGSATRAHRRTAPGCSSTCRRSTCCPPGDRRAPSACSASSRPRPRGAPSSRSGSPASSPKRRRSKPRTDDA